MTQFLSNRSKHVMLNGCLSKLVNVVSGVPRGIVLVPLLFLLHTSELFFILENKLIGYSDESTLLANVASPGVRVTVTESLIRDRGRASEWCDLWKIKLNANKTKTVIVSRSQYRRTFVHLSVFLWSDFTDPVLDGVRLAGFMSRANAFLLA